MELFHLTPSDGVFTLTRHGSNAPVGEFRSRSEALAACAKLTGSAEATLKVHREDGSVARHSRIEPGAETRRDDHPECG